MPKTTAAQRREQQAARANERDRAIAEQFERITEDETDGTAGPSEPPVVVERVSLTHPVMMVPMNAIHIQTGFNARQAITDDDPGLEELQTSLQRHGLINPLTVRPGHAEDTYLLIAGERRLRAARALGWQTIQAHVLTGLNDIEAESIMMTENIQRENLSLLEEALQYDRMVQTGLTHKGIAESVGKSRPYILSVLKLVRHTGLQAQVRQGLISGRMARAVARLLTTDGEERVPGAIDWICRWIAAERPTVDRANQMVQQCMDQNAIPSTPHKTAITAQRRISPAEREWQRWEAQMRPTIARRSRVEIREWYDTLLRMAEDTKQLLYEEPPAPLIESEKEQESHDAESTSPNV